MRETADILGVNINTLNKAQSVDRIMQFIKEPSTKVVFTPNSEIIMIARENEELMNILNSSDLLIADGIGVVWGGRLLGYKIPERVTGFDTMTELLSIGGTNGSVSFYLLGSSEEVIQTTVHNLKNKYPNINILGYHNGYYNQDEEKNIIEDINRLSPDILFVAFGAPKQEKWIYENKENLNVRVCMGIGGCFDTIAGKTKRAPKIFQKLGLEWLHRLIQEPKRIKRMIKLPQFALYVILKRIKLID